METEKPFLNSVPNRKLSPLFRQMIAASGPITSFCSVGTITGYSTILVDALQSPNRSIPVENDQISWIASIVLLPMGLGSILAGYLMEKCGRRTTQLLTNFLLIIGWLIIWQSRTLEQLYVGRIVTGVCRGLIGPSGSIYVSEVSDPHHRGPLLVGIALANAAGYFLVHLLGAFLEWELVAFWSTSIPIICIPILYFAPESPVFLINRGHTQQGEEVFLELRGRNPAALHELRKIVQHREGRREMRLTFRDVRRVEFWKPLAIMIVYFVTTQCSGMNTMVFYSLTIYRETLGEEINEYVAIMVVDSARLLMAVIMCFLMKSLGRRPLTNLSAVGTFCSLVVFVAYEYWDIRFWMAIPLVAHSLYVMSINVGFVPIPWAMIGEVFPQDMRGLGSGIATCVNLLSAFAVVKISPACFAYLNIYGTFTLFAACTLGGGVFLYCYLPETQGKTLHEIEFYFKGGIKEKDAPRTEKMDESFL